jgi:hypothetical protein
MFADASFPGSTGLGAIRLDLTPLHAPLASLDALRAAGWSLRDSVTGITLTRTDVADLEAALSALDPLVAAFVDVRVVGRIHGASLEIRRVGGAYEVQSVPQALPDELFDEGDIDGARLAWDRDADAAFALPLQWDIRAEVDLAKVVEAPDIVSVRVALSASTLAEAFDASALADLRNLVPDAVERRVYIALDSAAEPLDLGSVSFTGIRMATQVAAELRTEVATRPVREPLPAESSDHPALQHIPAPVALLLLGDAPTDTWWLAVARRCQSLAALITWAMIASDVTLNDTELVMEFRGFKRVTMAVDTAETLAASVCAGSDTLRRWAFHDASPDRLLALRQVISLYHDREALQCPQDVLDSAEVVYAGLRSDAVAEVVRSTREAHSQTLDTARQTVRAVQDLAKNAGDRLLASLVAIGAVVVANAGKSISDGVGRDLLLLVAAFLLVLAISATFLEGPLLSLPLTRLDDDLRRGSPLLSDEQRRLLTSLPSVEATRVRVRVLRVVIPAIYVAGAVLIVVFGDPSLFS